MCLVRGKVDGEFEGINGRESNDRVDRDIGTESKGNEERITIIVLIGV